MSTLGAAEYIAAQRSGCSICLDDRYPFTGFSQGVEAKDTTEKPAETEEDATEVPEAVKDVEAKETPEPVEDDPKKDTPADDSAEEKKE